MKNYCILVTSCLALCLACSSNKPNKPSYKTPIAITSPLANAAVSDTVNITTVVGTGYSFSHVVFYIDSDSVNTDSSLPFSYKWYTGNFPDNSKHSLKVVAYDTLAHASDSISVIVRIPGGPISIVRPLNGFIASDTTLIIARKAPAYTFQRVVFYMNGDSIGFDISATDTTIGVPLTVYTIKLNVHAYLDNSTLVLRAKGVTADSQYYSAPISIYTMFNMLTDTLEYVSTFPLTGPVERVASEGGHLYIAAGINGVYGIDVSSASAPVGEFVYDSPGIAHGVDINYPYMAIADGEQGIWRFDVSDPSNLILAGSFDTPGQSYNVKIVDSALYVADLTGLSIISIRGDSLVPRSRLALATGLAKDVDAIGTLVFVADIEGVTLVDASSPDNPQILSRYTGIGGLARTVSAVDSFVFIGTTTELLKLSVSHSDTLMLISRLPIDAGITGVFATESAVFVSLGTSNGALAIDYKAGINMTILSSFATDENCHDICANGPFVYLAAQDKVDILRFVR
jgi:hypothetical protein